jgi:hypothetical protein
MRMSEAYAQAPRLDLARTQTDTFVSVTGISSGGYIGINEGRLFRSPPEGKCQ